MTILCVGLGSDVTASGTDTTMLLDVVVVDCGIIDCVTDIITGVLVTSLVTGLFIIEGLSTFGCNVSILFH